MKASKIVISIAVAILVSFQVYSPTVSAHTGENFMIIIKENGSVPGNPTMMVNDSALWVNVDNRDNVTHQIFVDAYLILSQFQIWIYCMHLLHP